MLPDRTKRPPKDVAQVLALRRMDLRSPVYRDRYADCRPEGCICPIVEPGYVHEWCPVHDPDGTFHAAADEEEPNG